jgi:hypothetical protein
LAIGGWVGSWPAGGNPDNLLQSLIVRCGDAGGLKPQPQGFIEGAAGRYIAGAAEQDNHQ